MLLRMVWALHALFSAQQQQPYASEAITERRTTRTHRRSNKQAGKKPACLFFSNRPAGSSLD